MFRHLHGTDDEIRQALAILRASDLYECRRLSFIRCGRHIPLKELGALCSLIAKVTGSDEASIVPSWNEDRGDYVQVANGSTAYYIIHLLHS